MVLGVRLRSLDRVDRFGKGGDVVGHVRVVRAENVLDAINVRPDVHMIVVRGELRDRLGLMPLGRVPREGPGNASGHGAAVVMTAAPRDVVGAVSAVPVEVVAAGD